MDTQRLFISINIPTELHLPIGLVKSRLREINGSLAIRWTPTQQLHMTLAFLGNVKTRDVDDLLEALKLACAGEAPFKLALTGVSFLNGSVLWMDVSGETARLGELQSRIHAACSTYGDKLESKGFIPHVTIGRVGKGGFEKAQNFGRALSAEHKQVGVFGEWVADHIQLVRSEKNSNGVVYTDIANVALHS